MAPLSLKIILDNGAVTRKVKFETRTTVREAHEVIKEKVHVPDTGKEYALFLRSADDDKSGVWLEGHRPLDYYMLRDGDSLDYICRSRNLRVKMMDGTVKTLPVDESKPVGELMMTICARIGIANYDEYGLCHDVVEEAEEAKPSKEAASTGTLTLKRKLPQKERDVVLEQLSKKIKTDDYVAWLDHHRTLRELGVDHTETLLLKRRLFYSDRNVDSRDPVQLNLLYVQTRDAILNGRHPVTEDQAAEFAGIQCQIHFGDFQEDKHKPGFIENFQEYLPVQYSKSWGIEKKFLKAYRQHQGLSPLDAKMLYTKTARDLPTYGVTFFLVKEKQKDKKKLVPRLLGISAQSILRLDEVTKEILQQWPLTHVKSYHVGKTETFMLDFGDYSEKDYCVKTQDAHRIRDILEGYIDLIRKRMLAKHNVIGDESMVIGQEIVEASKGNIMQNVTHNATMVVPESFVGPSKIIQYEQGSRAQQGTQIVTVQQLIVTDQAKNKQEIIKGEVPLRGDMSMDCVRKLNRMNSNSVKIVTLLTDPTDVNVKDAQRIVENMEADMPTVNKGIQATSERQSSEEAQKMLLDELLDLNNYLNKLAYNTKPGQVNTEEAKEAAENIAGLSAQMYFSVDPRTRRRSEILNTSRKSFIACEKTDATIRRASFIAAASTALQTVDSAAQSMCETYRGPHLDDEQRENLERSMEDKIGRLNAALALYLTAHADSKNIDYPAAITSMNTINELMPELAKDAQIMASGKNPQERNELEEDMRCLFETTRKICELSGTEDHEKMQEASNEYAVIAGKLIFTIGRGACADKENELIDLAKDVGDKTSLLLMAVNELTGLSEGESASQELDDAGVRTVVAARDLLTTAQLTAPAIHEPHCRSALTAAAEGLSSSVQNLAVAWKPLVEDPSRRHMDGQLHARSMDVAKALDKLKDAYANIHAVGASDVEMADESPQERQRLKFISSISGAKNNLQGVEDLWDQTKSPSTETDKTEAQRRLAQMLAQLNASVAALAAATADRENPGYTTAELAVSTIAELLPHIVKDTEVVSSGKDEGTRKGMQQQVAALCDASRAICASAGPEDLIEAASKYSAASGKLVFLVSSAADKGKEKQIIELATIASGKASEMRSHLRRLTEEVGGNAQMDRKGAHMADCARALLTAAQVTAPSISEARCQNALISAAEQLRNSAGSLSVVCNPHLQQRQHLKGDLDDSHRELEQCLDMLTAACQTGHGGAGDDVTEEERKRLKFISSVTGAKNCLQAAEDQLKEPMICALMKEDDAIALQGHLSQRLACLNAAVAALAAAVADRENPDYTAANEAISTIAELMPQIIQDSKTVGTFNDDAGQAAMMKQIRELCEANRALCEGVGSPEALNEAVDKYVAASSKLKFLVSPAADKQKENEILDLSALACGRASELLSHVHRLTEQLDGDAGVQLDRRGARAADAAQALLTAAQVTAPSITEPSCQKVLMSAAEKLGNFANQLSAACNPHLQKGQPLQKDLQDSHRQLQESLSMLTDACQAGADGDPELKEKRRLKFISSVSGANNRLQAAQQQLKQPKARGMSSDADAAAAHSRLAQRLARLNAAVAALAAAVADRENPDYASAERAISTIAELMPQVVEDSQTVGATKQGAPATDFMQQVRAMCDAGQEICAGADNPESLSNAAAKYSAASGKIKCLVDPATDIQKQNQILDLSALACGRASELLSHVHRLTEQLDGDAAVQLDRRGARAADAAQALLTAAQVTAPSITEPSCQKVLMSAAEKLGNSVDQLSAACNPHLQKGQPLQKDLQDSHRQLQESLSMLTDACQAGADGDPELKEKRRLKFISSVSGANNRLQAAQQQLKQPSARGVPSDAAAAAAQSRLAQRLARLNAAVAALAAAVADRENPDYASAERAISTIAELMPQVVEDSQTVGATKQGAPATDFMQQVRAMCDAGQEICAGADNPESLSNAAAKYSAASGKIKCLVDPATDIQKQNQILDLSALACGRASELLSHVHRLTEQLDGDAGVQLDRRGAHAADAAQALLTAAQVTAPSITESSCQKVLISAADQLGNSAAQLAAACGPHLQKGQPLQADLQASHRQLQESLRMLTDACQCEDDKFPQEEKQRLKFINSASGANNRLKFAQEQLQKPLVCSLMREEDAVALQKRLSDKLVQLNAAVAALNAAVADCEKPDFVAADKAVKTIAELMPEVVQESRTVCSSKDDAGQAAMLEQVKALCDASQAMCASAGEPQGLSQATAKFTDASGKLVFLVGAGQPHGKGQGPVKKPKPPVPVRGNQTRTVAKAAPATTPASATQEFLDRLRLEESQDRSAFVVPAKEAKSPYTIKTDEEKIIYNQLDSAMKDAVKALTSAEQHLQTLHKEGAALTPGPGEFCEKLAITEDHMEETLAQAGVEVAALVSAYYADKMDYGAALQPATKLPKLVNSIVEDGTVVSAALDQRSRKAFLDDLVGLCSATKKLCDATTNDKEKLNDAAIEFGDKSAKLLHVVSGDANPALEKHLIARAKAIGDTASRLALEASTVASGDSAAAAGGGGAGPSPVRDICAAGTRCVDAAGKLVYTAKCVAPSIYHATCQDTLVASADYLSDSLNAFSNTWKPISDQNNVRKLTEEARNLEKLLEGLRRDVKAGMLGKKWGKETAVVLDTPLKQMTLKIIDDAKKLSVHTELSPEQRKEYSNYAKRLTEALRALDLANSRCQRATHDRVKHHQLDNAIQDLQMMVLQDRPKRAGVEQTNIVDLKDFLQEIVHGAEQLGDAAKRYQIASSRKPMEHIKSLCATMKSGAEELMQPGENRGEDTALDHILDIDKFGQECEDFIDEMKAATESIEDPRTVTLLQIKLASLVESCNLLRFATQTALSTTQGAAYDAAMNDLEEFETQVVKPLADVRAEERHVQRRSVASPRGALQAAAGAAAGGDPRGALLAAAGGDPRGALQAAAGAAAGGDPRGALQAAAGAAAGGDPRGALLAAAGGDPRGALQAAAGAAAGGDPRGALQAAAGAAAGGDPRGALLAAAGGDPRGALQAAAGAAAGGDPRGALQAAAGAAAGGDPRGALLAAAGGDPRGALQAAAGAAAGGDPRGALLAAAGGDPRGALQAAAGAAAGGDPRGALQAAAGAAAGGDPRGALQAAAGAAAGGDPRPLPRALTEYAVHVASHRASPGERVSEHICMVAKCVKGILGSGNVRAATWRRPDRDQLAHLTQKLDQELNQVPEMDQRVKREAKFQVLNHDDIQKLLLPTEDITVPGTQQQLEEKLQQLATKVGSISGTIILSVKKPESLARSLHATADAALQLAQTARALKYKKKPTAIQRIEENAREMCLATYDLLKTSELISHEPNHPNTKWKLIEACRLLNDAINKLVRSAHPEGSLERECGEVSRGVQLQQAALQATPQPCSALPYADCLATVHDQKDVIHKLNSDEAMSREEFMKSMNYVTSAITNSSECAAHCAYLLSVSENDENVGKEALIDVPKLHKMVAAVQESCISVIRSMHKEEVKEEKKVLEKQVEDLLKALDEAAEKTKSAELKPTLKRCREHLDESAKELYRTIDSNSPRNVTISQAMRLVGDLHAAGAAVDHAEMLPRAAALSADTHAMCEEVMENSRTLLTKTQDLIREVKTSPGEPEVMKWVMFTKRKTVIDAFEALLKSIRTSGQRVKLIETTVEETDGSEQKSYIQVQVELVKRWLLKPIVKAEVKTAGKEAVTNIIVIANKMAEDLKGVEKEEMNNLVSETVQLLKECSVKYDQDQCSQLMDRVRELQKLIERGVVTRVVEDFMDADAPLQDLDIFADAEKDESKRKFLLERKIAELLAQLGRVSRTARLLADTGSGGQHVSTQLNKCSEQTELLAPMLVKAAQQRVDSPNDQAVIENYKTLLAKYSESLAKVRDLCDRAVDPMDFVLTAGDTMQRMREESSNDNDPMKCAHTSHAITKLANRVIHVGMSSSSARADPELARALSAAHRQLAAATPAPDTRASKMPDWRDTTAKILRATVEVESVLGGENIFKKQPEPNQPIYKGALDLHVAIRDWSSRDNEIVAVAKRMAVLMAKLSDFMNRDKQRELLTTSKSIVTESHEVARLAKKLAHECTDIRIKTDLLKACERIPTISGQLKMLTTVKGSSLGHHGTHEDKEAMDMLVGNAQSLMLSIQDVIKGAASASVKIMSQRGTRMKWVRKNYY